ncbi:MAG: lysophospholipid acyltransferase family protein [Thermodesulfobacteriota bacterium]
MDFFRDGGRVLLCTFHQQFFPAIRPFQKYKEYHPSLMISRSLDGEIIAGVARRTGWHTVRGSSSKGGTEALKEMVDCFRQSRMAAHIVDGPLGPAGEIKPGAIRLAHLAEAAIVPFYTSAEKAWYFNSWDTFFIPKPFTKVRLCFGKMIIFDPTDDPEDFENQRRTLEQIMATEIRKKPVKR